MLPQDAVTRLPAPIVAALVRAMRDAYANVDEVVASSRLLAEGPHMEAVRGFNRWAAIERSVEIAWEEGLLPGKIRWVEINGSHQFYLEYLWEDVSVSFSHVDQPLTLPRKSVYRDNRAFDNEQWLFTEFAPAPEAAVNLLMTHGSKSLEFAHLALTRVIDGKLVALAWSENLGLADGGDFGFVPAPLPGGPIEPMAAEIVTPIRLAPRKEFIESEDVGGDD